MPRPKLVPRYLPSAIASKRESAVCRSTNDWKVVLAGESVGLILRHSLVALPLQYTGVFVSSLSNPVPAAAGLYATLLDHKFDV